MTDEPKVERRHRTTPMLSRHWLRGRRREGGERAYVDRYRRDEWTLVITIFAFSVADLVLTILYLEDGGEEANPIMRLVLQGGYLQFAVVKMLVTILGLLFALIHIRFRYIRQILIVVFCLSALLYSYHLYLRLQLT